MQDGGDLDALLRDGYFPVVEDLEEANEPWLERDLVWCQRVGHAHRAQNHMSRTYTDIEHQQPVEEGVARPQHPDRGLRELQPRYSQLR